MHHCGEFFHFSQQQKKFVFARPQKRKPHDNNKTKNEKNKMRIFYFCNSTVRSLPPSPAGAAALHGTPGIRPKKYPPLTHSGIGRKSGVRHRDARLCQRPEWHALPYTRATSRVDFTDTHCLAYTKAPKYPSRPTTEVYQATPANRLGHTRLTSAKQQEKDGQLSQQKNKTGYPCPPAVGPPPPIPPSLGTPYTFLDQRSPAYKK